MKDCDQNRRQKTRKLALQPLQPRCMMAADFAIAGGVADGKMDYGDAPNSYGTTLEVDGARHIVGGYRLGKDVDTEANGQPSGSATRDGLDEDGVRFLGSVAGITGRGAVDAWADTNGNGIFEDSEKFIDGEQLGPGENYFVAPDAEYYRFRASGKGGLDATGFGGIGEVEDYRRMSCRFVPPPHDVPPPPGDPGDPIDPDPIPEDPAPRDESEKPIEDKDQPVEQDRGDDEDRRDEEDPQSTSLDANLADKVFATDLLWR